MKPVSLEHVSKWYGKVLGLNDVSLEIGKGITGLLGPNGAGKSTMMKIITGQYRPSRGKVRIFGQPVWNRPSTLSRIGYVPESDSFNAWMTGMEFVTLAARLSGMENPRGEAARVLAEVGMEESAHRAISTYSKGMRQRIKVAQALVGSPDLLVMDEPLSGTDPVGRVDIMNLIERLAGEGKSVLVSSHVLHEVERMTDDITLINKGRLIAEGNIHRLREMMDEHPHTVLLETPEPRELARFLIGHELVESVSVEHKSIRATTPRPDVFYALITEVAAGGRYRVTRISSPDDNLEAVFEYLVG